MTHVIIFGLSSDSALIYKPLNISNMLFLCSLYKLKFITLCISI